MTKTEAQRKMDYVRSFKKKKSHKRYKHKHIEAPGHFDPRSIRTVRSGKSKVRIGCPKGKYSAKSKRCKVGTRAVSVLSPNPKPMTFVVFAIVKKNGKTHYRYLSERGFTSNYNDAMRYYKEGAQFIAKEYAASFPKYQFGVSDAKVSRGMV